MIRSDREAVLQICASFGLAAGPEASITPVSRGAVGRIWRLDAGTGRYALKETFSEPDEEAVGHETAITAHLAAAGIRIPRSLPAGSGRFLVPLASDTGGSWLRLFEWIDGEPADLADPATADRIGHLLGRLHAHALPSRLPVDPWYETTPDPATWDELAEAARKQGAGWSQELAGRNGLLRALAELVTPAAPAGLLTCHRDLHPDNVLVEAGDLVPLDWDDAGPACPGRELAGVLMFWHVSDGAAGEAAAERTLRAYRAAGGPGRLRDERAFGMYLAGRLNFLRGQATLALDPAAGTADRGYASAEVSDTLARLPTLPMISRLIALANAILG
jgi:Ser/Thr protein kinase RdoA (MazF antagonist)